MFEKVSLGLLFGECYTFFRTPFTSLLFAKHQATTGRENEVDVPILSDGLVAPLLAF